MTDGPPPSDSTEQYDGTPASGPIGEEDLSAPETIGRYRITTLIARGGFGSVYRAKDESLQREVAIKIPRRRSSGAVDLSRWMSEARMVAMLDHPNIVPVYDAESTEDGQFYVVSKFVEGEDLRACLEHERPTVSQSVDWIIAIAEALQHAHSNGLVHRDVKPSNILLDRNRRPWLTDFGLAMREDEIGREVEKNKLIGTVNYMSPEQARGEGHLVDGRADIFSLGVILYELLCGSRPFQGGSSRQLLRNIVNAEPRPLRQWDPRLPVELERICMKALAQRRSDRYSSASDVAEDLERFAKQGSPTEAFGEVRPSADTVPADSSAFVVTDAPVIPKGLRSFDEHDSDFFLKLVPGPRDRKGIPEILRRLKMRVQSRTRKASFRAGMLYGSSGSGKSSLVRAGLVPLLDDSVSVVYVESTADTTESRLLRALSQVVDVSGKGSHGLISTMASIRRDGLGGGRKALIVLDQFEQWLHAHKEMANSELVNAIRQCDGIHVQCLVLIRDDFWMPATEFFYELEIPLVQDVNSTAVDRFELRHARYVLAEFGRAYGCLPKDTSETTVDQNGFLDAVIESIQQDGKVISVHLAVIAQMLKGKLWSQKTLAEYGGTEGVDINFLDATFTGSTAAPHHRSVEAPARAVLAMLLPESGSDIKGQMQDADRLRDVSGLNQRRFEELLNTLDGELRLITPTVATNGDSEARTQRCYQLTHDFLVPPLREWLTRTERQSVRGRTRLRLTELSQYWRTKQESRFLPNVFEYLRIIAFTDSAHRNADESKLVAAATRYHGSRWAIIASVLMVAIAGAVLVNRQIRESSKRTANQLIVNQLLAANVENVPRVIESMQPMDAHMQTLLKDAVQRDDQPTSAKLHARMALVGGDAQQVDPLVEAITVSRPKEIRCICESLFPYRRQVTAALWAIIQSETVDEVSWLRAANGLAHLDPDNDRWNQHVERLARAIVSQTTPTVVEMAPAFSKLSKYLLEPGRMLFKGTTNENTGVNAAVILAEILPASDPLLVDLLVSASPPQFEILFDVASSDPDAIVPLLKQELTVPSQHRWPPSELDSDVPNADAAVRRVLEQAGGMLTPTFALCQTLPLSEFDGLARQLDSCGYRPEVVRTYLHRSEPTVAAVWHRDGRMWRFTRHVGADDAMGQVDAMRKLGLFPNDVTEIVTADEDAEEVEYGVVWTPLNDGTIDSRMYVGVTEEDHYDAWDPMNKEQFVPKTNLKLKHPDGTDRYCSVRKRMIMHPGYDDAWTDVQADYEARILEGWQQVDVRLNPTGKQLDYLSFAATWWNGGEFESRTPYLLDPEQHLEQAEEFAKQGFRPVSISVIDDPEGLLAASVWHRPHLTEDELDRVAGRQANSLIALSRLGNPEVLWPMMESRSDSRLRSLLINRLSSLGAAPQVLVQQLLNERNDSRRFALIAALAQYRPEQLSIDQADTLRGFIRSWGTSDPSAAIHSICEYIARRWKWDDVLVEIENAKPPKVEPMDSPRWYNTTQGHTMVVIEGPSEFTMGSPGHELFRDHSLERTKRVRIPRTYAIAAAEITLQQFQRFVPDFRYAGDYTPSDLCPVNSVSMYDAMKYCRWLSEQEGIPEDQMCYPRDELIGIGFELPSNFLERTGYRLPTEAEWEFAGRAMTTTPRHFGYSNELIPSYAWTVENPLHLAKPRLHPVKLLLPNDFGLFDTLGNIMEWCQSPEGSGGETKHVQIDGPGSYNAYDTGVLRGSAIFYPTSSTRSASREKGRTTYQYPYYGFRIARTMPKQDSAD